MPDTREASAERARTPLLSLITAESLDQDYLHVAEKRAAAGSVASRGRPSWVAAIVVMAFGVLVAVAAVRTSAESGVASANRQSLLEQIQQDRAEAADLQRDLVRHQTRNIGLAETNEAVVEAEAAAVAAQDRLAARTGFGRVSGPGVEVTVNDAANGEAVRDEDLAKLVNGLWEAGAEAISINGKRLTARSALRNAGAAINLNGPPPLSPPYVVSAIGDNRALQADVLDTSTGLEFDNLADALGFRVTWQSVDDLTLPAAPQRLLEPTWIETGDDGEQPPGKEPPS